MSQSQPQILEVGDEFLTAENFKEVAQQGAKAAGFAFSVSSSKISGGGKGGHTPFITLQCTIGGTYRNNHKINEETRKRKKLSKRQNCPVVLRAALNENTRTWVVTSSKSVHNHELLIPSQIHCLPQHRHLNTEQKELVHIMLKSGASTRSIADAIYWKQSTVYTKDIINECDRIKNALNEGTNYDTTMRLIKMLEKRQYILCHLLTKDGHMLNLFFTHIEAARQVAICPEVLIIDTIYKTNLYKLPLINAVGISNIEVFGLDRALALRKAADKKVAHAEETNKVEKAFKEVSQATMKIRDPEYIQNYLEEWKKDAECWMHRAERSHSALKKAIEASSGLEQVFLHIDHAFHQHQLQTNGALGSNIAIDRIKKEVCEIDENKNMNNSPCNCSLRLNYKLPCHHIIPPTGPVLLTLVHKRWHLKHDSVPSIPLSLSIDMTISKVLYKLEEKYKHLNDSGSKATFLHKLEALVTEEIPVPKAPLHNTKLVEVLQQSQQPLFYDQIPIFIHEYIKKVVNIDGDGNCKYRAVAVGLERNENEWPNIRKKLFEELNKNGPFY
ncbi:1937_t:CDS:2 [Dentiscutata erythropus]|uniref:1937_t:CDS:1 n=1 Tax=Dentiscutata erythropus TaxID=1348616 RepID=A0A9N9H9Y9_9GLOM|nr:1937_t:CDS:2 [Dentiscutata erythropus]